MDQQNIEEGLSMPQPMDGYRDMPIEEMVRIEDKVDLSNCPGRIHRGAQYTDEIEFGTRERSLRRGCV